MSYPIQQTVSFKTQLDSGFAAGLDLPTDGDVTAIVGEIQLPNPERFVEQMSVHGAKATLPVPFGMLPMETTVQFIGQLAVCEALLDSEPTFIHTYNLHSLDNARAVTRDTSVHTWTFYVASIQRNNFQNPTNGRPNVTLTAVGTATKYKSKHSNNMKASWDIDVPAGNFYKNGVDIFTGAVQA